MYLEKVKKFVNDSFQNKFTEHFERTLYWILKLKSDADEALQIAAYAHDIERANRKVEIVKKLENSPDGFLDKEFLSYHQNTGAKIIADFLRENSASKELIDRVVMLISKHEVGGNDDQNLLMDCDSISFFETNAEGFICPEREDFNQQKVRDKFDWMYNRIFNLERKKIAKSNYEKIINELNKING
ncbi:MAG: DUF4202 family protein [bacterium]|nr:DUF4202 family protein [bacterium]